MHLSSSTHGTYKVNKFDVLHLLTCHDVLVHMVLNRLKKLLHFKQWML